MVKLLRSARIENYKDSCYTKADNFFLNNQQTFSQDAKSQTIF